MRVLLGLLICATSRDAAAFVQQQGVSLMRAFQSCSSVVRAAALQNDTETGIVAIRPTASSGQKAAEEDERDMFRRSQLQAEQASRLMSLGATANQVAAYTGIKFVPLDEEVALQPKVTPSHEFAPRDNDGELRQASFVYVDEYTCIGCTNCAMTAPNTFYMEDDYGRARVFRQWGDRKSLIQTAIETCPVDCIHYVDFEELQRLEKERAGLKVNFKARLVGSDALLSSSGSDLGMQDISGNRNMRCNNCPTKGCYNCPMYSIGENPEYQKRKAQIEAKRAARKAQKETVKRKRTEL